MMISNLDGRQRSKRAVLRKIGRDLGWGRPLTNLDALYDVLRRRIPGPFQIDWWLTPRAREALGADLEPIAAVLRQVAAERRDVRLWIGP
jgi:hypothetical protein